MALVGFLWAEIGLRLFAKVPASVVGLACCVGGSICLAYRYMLNQSCRGISSRVESEGVLGLPRVLLVSSSCQSSKLHSN